MSTKRRKNAKRPGSPSDRPTAQRGELQPVRSTVLNPQPLNPANGEARKAVTQTITAYKGPIPPPDFLLAYSDAIHDGGERVFAMIEAEAKHIQAQEKTALEAQVSLLKRGQGCAFIIALVAIGGAIYSVPFSVPVALTMVTLGLGTLAVAFLGMARKNGNREADDKKK